MIFDEYTVSIQDKATGKEVRGGSVENGVYKLHAMSSLRTLRLVICGITDLAT